MGTIDERYNAMSAQISHHLDEAAKRRSPGGIAISFGHTWLAAEMFMRTEETYIRAQKARAGILAALESRIRQMEIWP